MENYPQSAIVFKGLFLNQLGIVEGFFGPQWSEEARVNYAQFLSEVGAQFYIYAPKKDPYLRKAWREDWTPEYLGYLKSLVNLYHEKGISFGVALSPFGLEKKLDEEDRKILIQKMKSLNEIGIDLLGIFFDDMPSFELLAEVQIEVVHFLKNYFSKKIIFCPTYYTYDPILEKVFGQMPTSYWEKIAEGIPLDVEIAWTGPKVISSEISNSHLQEVSTLLKRKPFLWENLYANDGPRNCKFLKIKPFTGREKDFMEFTSGMAMNLMNQPYLSQITFLATKKVVDQNQEPELALGEAIDELCTGPLADFIKTHRESFLTVGLDKIEQSETNQLIMTLSQWREKMAMDITDWLQGKYIVGSECLTD